VRALQGTCFATSQIMRGWSGLIPAGSYAIYLSEKEQYHGVISKIAKWISKFLSGELPVANFGRQALFLSSNMSFEFPQIYATRFSQDHVFFNPSQTKSSTSPSSQPLLLPPITPTCTINTSPRLLTNIFPTKFALDLLLHDVVVRAPRIRKRNNP
jgi:hypothetical protein